MASPTYRDTTDFVICGYDLLELDGYLLEWDKVQQSTDSNPGGEEANLSTVKMAMAARLKDQFRHLLSAYTISNEYDSDSSFSSTPSHVRLSISSNNTVDEISYLDPQIEELASSRSLTVSVPEVLDQELQDISGQDSNFPSIIAIPELNSLPIQAQGIYYLRCVAERMIAAGYTQECIETYCGTRRRLMDANLIKLGIETLSFRHIQLLDSDVLARKIKSWIKATKIAFEMMFGNEKLLVNHIFNGLLWVGTALDEFCFTQTVKDPAMQLFVFAQAISQQTSPEKLFMLLDVYKALSELLPEIKMIFEGKYFLESIHAQAVTILSKLADAARAMLESLEKSLINEIGSKVPEGGGILLLNRYVMNYLKFIADYAYPLTDLIVSKPPSMELENVSDHLNMDFVKVEGMSPLELHLNWIITILLFKLEQKFKLYENASLAHFFMMNNIHYMAWKIESSKRLKAAIGDDSGCLKMLTVQFRMAAIAYERSTWVSVLYCLRDKGLHVNGSVSSGVSKTALRDRYVNGSVSSGVSKTALRERFKAFNAMFEEVHRTQATWLVPDVQLREELRISISLKLIPAYRSFIGRFGSYIESGRHPENYIMYSVKDLESAVLDFFEGYPVSQHLRRRSQ